MSTIEGWPYEAGKRREQQLTAKYTRAVDVLRKADARMRRAFHTWEKARAAVKRLEDTLDREFAGKDVHARVVGDEPELNDEIPPETP